MRRINLLPENFQKAERLRFIGNSAAVIVGPAVLALLSVHFLLVTYAGHLGNEIRRPADYQEGPEARQAKDKIDALQARVRDFGRDNADIINSFVKRPSAARLLNIISRISCNKVWLNNLLLDTDERTCRIDGKSFNTRLVSEFMLELKQLPYFENVELISMGRNAADGEKETDFSFICHLK